MVRVATVKDIPKIIQMAYGFYNEALKQHNLGYKTKDYEKYILFLLDASFTEVFVLEKDGEVVGTIAGIVSPWFMDSNDVILTEQWVWVESENRGNGAFDKLLNALVSWGKGLGANKLSMISIGNGTEEQVKKFYTDRGFQYMETHFIKEI